MALVNFRQIRERFTHIDASFVSCALHLPEGKCALTVNFYPWWEHPAYIEACQKGKTWGFADASAQGELDVVVYPRGLQEWHLSPRFEVTDWKFTEDHPLFWDGAWNGSTIDCNSPMSVEQVLQLVDLIRKETGRWRDPFEFLTAPNFEKLLAWARGGSFRLGGFSQPLYDKVLEYLAQNQVQVYAPYRPAPESNGVVLTLDGGDYIIADDFDLEVPEFEHQAEWFKA